MQKSVENFETARAKIFTGTPFGVTNSDKALIVALDDSLISGVSGSHNLLRYPDAALRGVTRIASAVLAFPGRFDNFSEVRPNDLAIITNVTASVEGPHHLDKVLIMEPDMAIDSAYRLGASGISYHLNHTSDEEGIQIRNAFRIGEAARAKGFEYAIHGYPRTTVRRWFSPWRKTEYHYRARPGERTSLRKYTNLILDTAAVAIDSGATTVKLPRPGDTDHAIEIVDFVHRNNVKVVFAGGRVQGMSDYLHMVRSDMDAGADGEAVGRNYFRRRLGPPEEPERHARKLLEATARIVHLGNSVEEALVLTGLDRSA